MSARTRNKGKKKGIQEVVSSAAKMQQCVLVGTYKKQPRQLPWIDRYNIYNYPLSEDEAKSGAGGWNNVKELWIYSGRKDERHVYEVAKFVGIKTCDEFFLDYPDYPKSKKPHGAYYAIFNVAKKCQPTLKDAVVIVRASDFKQTPNISKAIKAYQDGGGLGCLLDILPSELAPLQHDRLCIYETAMQYCFWDIPKFSNLRPPVPFPPPEKPKFTFIDLFAGIGGFRLAMQDIGGECVFSSEWDKDAQSTYTANYGEQPYGDIRPQATKDCIPQHFDVLCAGFPCQPFSLAGVSARNAAHRAHGFQDETQGTLFFDILQIIRQRRPLVVFLENVKNLVNHDKGRTFDVIRRSIEREGYSFSYKLIDASPLVPQKRVRCYMVCIRDGAKFEFPEISGCPLPLKSILERDVPESFTISDGLWAGHQRRTQNNLARGAGFTAFTANLDEPSHTLVARYYKDGKECLIPQEGKNPRMLTPRECARLQGFPERFVLPKAKSKAYKQMGNSVAVPVLKKIAKNIFEQVLA